MAGTRSASVGPRKTSVRWSISGRSQRASGYARRRGARPAHARSAAASGSAAATNSRQVSGRRQSRPLDPQQVEQLEEVGDHAQILVGVRVPRSGGIRA